MPILTYIECKILIIVAQLFFNRALMFLHIIHFVVCARLESVGGEGGKKVFLHLSAEKKSFVNVCRPTC